MKKYLLIFLSIHLACKESDKNNLLQLWEGTVYLSDSFQFQQENVLLQVVRMQNEDSFQLVCKTGKIEYLDTTLDSPPSYVEAMNIFGDSLPEIIVNDCLSCDLGRIRLFFFDRNKNQFLELKGTDELLSDIYTLNGADLIYNVASFNQGGSESNLIRVVGDTCFKLANMFVPYSEEPIQISRSSMPAKVDSIQHSIDIDTDSLIPLLWRRYLMETK